jgi:hypothetical protein
MTSFLNTFMQFHNQLSTTRHLSKNMKKNRVMGPSCDHVLLKWQFCSKQTTKKKERRLNPITWRNPNLRAGLMLIFRYPVGRCTCSSLPHMWYVTWRWACALALATAPTPPWHTFHEKKSFEKCVLVLVWHLIQTNNDYGAVVIDMELSVLVRREPWAQNVFSVLSGMRGVLIVDTCFVLLILIAFLYATHLAELELFMYISSTASVTMLVITSVICGDACLRPVELRSFTLSNRHTFDGCGVRKTWCTYGTIV